MRTLSFVAGLMVVSAVLAQPPDQSSSPPASAKTRKPGRSHLLVRFTAQPGQDQLSALADRGAAVLSYVPKSTLSVAALDGLSFAGLGAEWVGRLQPAQKISPQLNGALSSSTAIPVVVEFYSDVPSSEARAIANETGLAIRDHPDLLPNHLLLTGTGSQLLALAQWDEVSYIFPASPALVQGTPVHGCAGALTADGPVGQSIPLVGGWDGPGLPSVNLNYAFVYLTQQDPADAVESEIERAYAEWSKVVQVTFTQTTDATAPQTIAVLFASGAHGDGYPFEGPGGVLAHTFYPYPVNPEPIAGDSHFNNDETWKIGADVDVFSVALHETGHALGLGHSDNPADVMYPYYRMVTGLSPGDIAAVQQLYAAAGSSDNPAAPTAPPSLPSPTPPSTPTAATSFGVDHSARGNEHQLIHIFAERDDVGRLGNGAGELVDKSGRGGNGAGFGELDCRFNSIERRNEYRDGDGDRFRPGPNDAELSPSSNSRHLSRPIPTRRPPDPIPRHPRSQFCRRR